MYSPLGVNEFDLMVFGGSDTLIMPCPGMWFSCHLRSYGRTMALLFAAFFFNEANKGVSLMYVHTVLGWDREE